MFKFENSIVTIYKRITRKKIDIQWKPLNVITLEPDQSDHINRMITLTDRKEAKMAFWDII